MSEMPWAQLHFDGAVLRPRSGYDLQIITERYKPGSTLRGKFSQVRSKNQHDLYWAVLREIVEATGRWHSADDLHEAIKFRLRMVRGIEMLGGFGTRYITQSINFSAMDQGEFNRFFDHAKLVISEDTGIDVDFVIRRIKQKWGPRFEA